MEDIILAIFVHLFCAVKFAIILMFAINQFLSAKAERTRELYRLEREKANADRVAEKHLWDFQRYQWEKERAEAEIALLKDRSASSK